MSPGPQEPEKWEWLSLTWRAEVSSRLSTHGHDRCTKNPGLGRNENFQGVLGRASEDTGHPLPPTPWHFRSPPKATCNPWRRSGQELTLRHVWKTHGGLLCITLSSTACNKQAGIYGISQGAEKTCATGKTKPGIPGR